MFLLPEMGSRVSEHVLPAYEGSTDMDSIEEALQFINKLRFLETEVDRNLMEAIPHTAVYDLLENLSEVLDETATAFEEILHNFAVWN